MSRLARLAALLVVLAGSGGALATEREWYRDEPNGRLVFGTPGSGDMVLTITCGDGGLLDFGVRVRDEPGFSPGGTVPVVYGTQGEKTFAYEARLLGEAATDGAWDAVFSLPPENDLVAAILDGPTPFSRTMNGGYVYPWNLYDLYPALVDGCS